MKMRFPLISLIVVATCFAQNSPEAAKENSQAAKAVSFCDLIRNPEKFDGQRVTVTAVYYYWFEWDELLCVECREVGKLTFFDVSYAAPDRVEKQLSRLPKDGAVVSGLFTGVFEVSDSYNRGFHFHFKTENVEKLKILRKGSLREKDALSKLSRCCKLRP